MFDNFLYVLHNIWAIGLIRFVVFLALGFVAAKVVSGLVTKWMQARKGDKESG